MAVQTGKNKGIRLQQNAFAEICHALRLHKHETGGIVGVNEDGVICAFQADNISKPALYEYCPNTIFLNEVINGCWSKSNISFVGFVHSHLHNAVISRQDIAYAREILKANEAMDRILMGIVNLSEENDSIKWLLVSLKAVVPIKVEVV